MGGFILFFLLLTVSGLLLMLWLISRNRVFGLALKYIWISVAGLIGLLLVIHPFVSPKKVKRSDVYGQYVVDRTKFSGRQADWQYSHFRFEITKADSFFFYETEQGKVSKVYRGRVQFPDLNNEGRLSVLVDSPRHHILHDQPILYRGVWSFYYVFRSPKFGNVFFTKGTWKALPNEK